MTTNHSGPPLIPHTTHTTHTTHTVDAPGGRRLPGAPVTDSRLSPAQQAVLVNTSCRDEASDTHIIKQSALAIMRYAFTQSFMRLLHNFHGTLVIIVQRAIFVLQLITAISLFLCKFRTSGPRPVFAFAFGELSVTQCYHCHNSRRLMKSRSHKVNVNFIQHLGSLSYNIHTSNVRSGNILF